jgi:phospholipase/lecithinase/hemolysin
MKRLLAAVLGAGALGASLPALAALSTLSELFAFGDSLSDGGNSGLLTKSLLPPDGFPPVPYAGGRYSNGPVAAEYLWQRYNPGSTDFKPSLGGGTNYAIGGATTGRDNYNLINPNVPSGLRASFNDLGLAPQLGQFQAFVTGGGAFDPATSLFVVWAFPNDAFWLLTTSASPPPGGPGPHLPDQPLDQPPAVAPTPDNLVAQGIQNIVAAIGLLATLGGQHFLVPNMPDLGKTPFGLGQGDIGSAGLTALTEGFNDNLALALAALDNALPGAEIVQFDTFGAFAALRADPGALGFANTSQACIDFVADPDPSKRCNPDTWVFWDGVHPTTAAHAVLGAMFAAAVPEPGSLALTATLLLLLIVGARRRAARAGGREAARRGAATRSRRSGT